MKIASKEISAVSLVQEALDKAKKYAYYDFEGDWPFARGGKKS